MIYLFLSSQNLEQLFLKILSVVIGGLILRFLLFKNKRKWLHNHPMFKHRIDMAFYVYLKFVCGYLYGFFVFGTSLILLTSQNYFTSVYWTASISFVFAVLSLATLKYLYRDLKRPQIQC